VSFQYATTWLILYMRSNILSYRYIAYNCLIVQGLGCARIGRPGVYARVSAAFDWINSQICQLSENPPSECNINNTPAGRERIRVDVQYGNLPEETSWSITDSSKEEVLAELPVRSVLDPTILLSYYVDLEPGEYEFDAKNLDGGKCGLWFEMA
jgi:hypothetical protein